MAQNFASPQQTSPVSRIPLPEDATPVLEDLFYGPVEPRGGEKKIVRGAGETELNRTFVLIEAARRPDIEVILAGFETPYVPLYQGDAADAYARHAPYLAEVRKGDRFSDWLIEEGWNSGWGVWLRSAKSLAELRRHFRKFTQLYNPTEERWFIFRFYAPETVRRIVPALPPSEFASFTQNLSSIIVPDASGSKALVI